ncbi:MAG TPA: hypothetical protein ENH03_05170 [Candidatus Bathyarchaeota archaeon]|nr:hypothetical protein [Candidatus Bathyarchaeota archaeon]
MLMDEYRKSWALRYLREAVNEINIAKRNSSASNLILDAVRKAQTAIYYSLGEPAFIERIVEEALEKKLPVESPILRFLVGIERSIKWLESIEISSRSDLIIKESDKIISIASKIVNLLMSED